MLASGPANVPVTAKLPRELVSGLERLAKERGISRSAVVRRLADAALKGDLQLQGEVERAVELKSQRMREYLAGSAGRYSRGVE